MKAVFRMECGFLIPFCYHQNEKRGHNGLLVVRNDKSKEGGGMKEGQAYSLSWGHTAHSHWITIVNAKNFMKGTM